MLEKLANLRLYMLVSVMLIKRKTCMTKKRQVKKKLAHIPAKLAGSKIVWPPDACS